jgi:excinuclease UvrABC helicase subunit UvrB
MDEVIRRSKIQEDYNKEHGITPRDNCKAGKRNQACRQKDGRGEQKTLDKIDLAKMSRSDIAYFIEELRDQMDMASQEFGLSKKRRNFEIKSLPSVPRLE